MNPRTLYAARLLFIAGVYGSLYFVTRGFSLDTSGYNFNWAPEAALRFGCLFFLPVRYWSALVLGEAVALGYANYQCLDELGILWVSVNSLPRAVEVMPVVWLLRRYIPDMGDAFVRRTPLLLACFAGAATGPTLFGWLSYSLMRQLPTGEQRLSFVAYSGQLFMGHYLALLSFMPLMLWAANRVKQVRADKKQASDEFIRFAQGYRWLVPVALVGINGLMLLLGRYGGDSGQRWAIVGIFATLLPITWSYGWPGTAMVGAMANIAVVSIMPAYDDINTLSAQMLMLMFLSALLMFAAKTSTAEQHREEERLAIRNTRRAYMLTERQRLASANHMDDVLDEARLATTRLIQCARPFLPASVVAEHHRQFEALHERYQRLLLGLSPCDWWELGNPDGPIVSALRGERIGCDVLNMPVRAHLLPLSVEIGVAIKQLTCEATLHLLDCAPRDRISMDITAIAHDDGHDIHITLETTGYPLALTADTYERLMVGMGALGLNEQGLRGRAQLYSGHVEVTRLADGEARVMVKLVDKPKQMIA